MSIIHDFKAIRAAMPKAHLDEANVSYAQPMAVKVETGPVLEHEWAKVHEVGGITGDDDESHILWAGC